MRPKYLEFVGVNSFSEPAAIDFEKLSEFGIFGIFGDTGSGKSTILDCIGFALYGDVARSRTGTLADVINYRQDRASVSFEFEIYYEGERRVFRAERGLKRKKDGAEQTLTVYERKDGKLVAVADGVREGNALLKRIVGLEQRDFEKCIALPQGEFSQFVKAPRGERLRIISRLFDLEQYGDSLVRRANANCQRLSETISVLKARLDPYDGLTESGLKALRKEIAKKWDEENALSLKTDALRDSVNRLASLLERKKERETLEREFSLLVTQKESMDRLAEELDRLNGAALASARADEYERARARKEGADRALLQETARRDGAEKELSALPLFDTEAAEREIARLEQVCALSARAREDGARLARLERERQEDEKRARELTEAVASFDYASEKAEIEARLNALPDEDFFKFFEEQGKQALLRGEYAAVKEDFETLYRANPSVKAIEQYIEKYSALSEGERADLKTVRKLFEARDRAKKAAQNALLELEKRQERALAYRREADRLRLTAADKARDAAQIRESLRNVPAEGADEALAALKAKKRRYEIEKRRLDGERTAAVAAFAAASARAESETLSCAEAKDRLEESLREGGFTDADEARALLKRYGDAAQAKETIVRYRERTAALTDRLNALAGDTEGAREEDLAALRETLRAAEEERKAVTEALAVAREREAADTKRLEEKKRLEQEYGAVKSELETAERLKSLLKDNKFMEFVAEEYLQTVAYNASGRLLTLTDGRYFLRYDGGFYVGDNFNGGEKRAVYTLSGGETFLVSLSLALALSAEICLKSARPIEFFFLDEGFGTLDEKLVDAVMDSLERLRSERFSIGVISHVEELKHRIGRKILVKKATEQHGSQITAE